MRTSWLLAFVDVACVNVGSNGRLRAFFANS